jgi:uncharacterized membrane protein YcaP (DUF421 family)
MSWVTSSWGELGVTAAKAALMYATALIGLRLGERRTLAQWTLIDYVAAVAVGAIVGRTAIASTQSYAIGAVALLTLLLLHRLTSLARFHPTLRHLTDHRVRVLAVDGRLDARQLRLCGLTEDDVLAELRQRGVFDLDQVRYLLYEVKGGLTIVPAESADGELVTAALRSSIGYPQAAPAAHDRK